MILDLIDHSTAKVKGRLAGRFLAQQQQQLHGQSHSVGGCDHLTIDTENSIESGKSRRKTFNTYTDIPDARPKLCIVLRLFRRLSFVLVLRAYVAYPLDKKANILA